MITDFDPFTGSRRKFIRALDGGAAMKITSEQEQAIRRDERVKTLREVADYDVGTHTRSVLRTEADRLEAEGRKSAESKPAAQAPVVGPDWRLKSETLAILCRDLRKGDPGYHWCASQIELLLGDIDAARSELAEATNTLEGYLADTRRILGGVGDELVQETAERVMSDLDDARKEVERLNRLIPPAFNGDVFAVMKDDVTPAGVPLAVFWYGDWAEKWARETYGIWSGWRFEMPKTLRIVPMRREKGQTDER